MPEAATDKKYKITKQHCKTLMHGVCSGCGGELVPIETVDNARNPTFWPGCKECNCFDYGVQPLAFQIAHRMVTKYRHVQYGHMDSPDGKDEGYRKYWLASQVRGTSIMVSLVLAMAEEVSKENSIKS